MHALDPQDAILFQSEYLCLSVIDAKQHIYQWTLYRSHDQVIEQWMMHLGILMDSLPLGATPRHLVDSTHAMISYDHFTKRMPQWFEEHPEYRYIVKTKAAIVMPNHSVATTFMKFVMNFSNNQTDIRIFSESQHGLAIAWLQAK